MNEYKASVIKKSVASIGGIVIGAAITLGSLGSFIYCAGKSDHIERIMPEIHQIGRLEESLSACESDLRIIKQNPEMTGSYLKYGSMQEKCDQIKKKLDYLKEQPEIFEARRLHTHYDYMAILALLGAVPGVFLIGLGWDYLAKKDK